MSVMAVSRSQHVISQRFGACHPKARISLSGSGMPAIPVETTDALRSAIIEHVTLDPAPETQVLDRVIERLTREGQHLNLRVEQLLVVVKSCWHELPLAIRRSPRAAPDVLLNRMVQGCIRTYYADSRRRRRLAT